MMRSILILVAIAAIGAHAHGQILISSGTVSGLSGGTATPVGGGPTISADEMNTPFTVNGAQTSGSGGTSGGLGENGAIGRTSVQFNVTSEQARGGGGLLLRITGTGMAEFDTVNYTGNIGSSFLISTLFITIGGTGPMEFVLAGSGGWSSLPVPGTIQPIEASGASINGNLLTPGTYVFSLPSVNVNAGTTGTNVPTFEGQLVLIVPSGPVGMSALLGAGVVALRRRRS